MNLEFFYEDPEQQVESDRPNDFYLEQALELVGQDISNLEDATNKYYTTKMWQWFKLYKIWVGSGSGTEMFEQPKLEDCRGEITKHFRNVFKSNRQKLVDNIKVTVDGMIFDGDEVSRSRMVTAVVAAINDTETIPWSLADNTIADVTRVQLKEALRLSGIEMSSIWIQT